MIRKFIEPLRECIQKVQSGNFTVILKALPLYHWFCNDPPRDPFFLLEYDVESISQLIRNKSKYILSFQLEDRYLIISFTIWLTILCTVNLLMQYQD